MAKESIIIIDYGAGNIRSAAKAFEHVIAKEGLEAQVLISGNADDIAHASRIVLPGQGAFGDCISALKSCNGMIEALENAVLHGKTPFLGICVGMQLMVQKGYEHGIHEGLGWLDGEVVAINPDDKSLKIPHMGWNEMDITTAGQSNFVLSSTKTSENYYFVHSFMVESKNEHNILGYTNYGAPVVAAIGRDNMLGVQFHPEKSQDAGLRLISSFLKWSPSK